MMAAVDKGDAARFTREEVLDPKGWDLLNFLMDARTGLGRFRDFRISNYKLMMALIDACKNHTIGDIMALPDVRGAHRRCTSSTARSARTRSAAAPRVHKNLVVLDLRNEEVDLRRQPLHHLRAVPGDEHLDPRAVGPEEPEHRVRHRQVDPEPQLAAPISAR